MWIRSTGIYFNRIVHICAHRWVCSYMYIVLHILQSQARTQTHPHTHGHTHTYTYDVRTHAHAHTHTHVNMFILTNKRSSIYIQTVFFLACFLYCKGDNLYCTRVVPLYLFFVFLFFSVFYGFFLYGRLIYMPFCFLCWILCVHVLYFCSWVTSLYVFLCKNAHHFGIKINIRFILVRASPSFFGHIYMFDINSKITVKKLAQLQ